MFRAETRGPEGKERFKVAAAILPPSRLRLEFFGPIGGPRLVVVTDGEEATAILPAERTYDRAEATAETMDRLLGIPLDSERLIALITGRPMCSPEAAEQQIRTRKAATFGRTVAWYEVNCPPGEIRYRAMCEERGGQLRQAIIREGISGDTILEVEYDGYEQGPGPRWPSEIRLRLSRRQVTVTLRATEGPRASHLSETIFATDVPAGFQRKSFLGSFSAPGLLGSTAKQER